MATRRTGWMDDDHCLLHDAGDGFPERPARLVALRKHLARTGLRDQLTHLTARAATPQEIQRVHRADYLWELEHLADTGWCGFVEPSTPFTPLSLEAAWWSAGCALEATIAVLTGSVRNAFSAGRPPGHHARPRRAMGFCFFNNIALAAKLALQSGLDRVAILDWDVHHGNGTQEIFYTDPQVLFISVHQDLLYPGTGFEDEIGEGEGEGFNVNFPLPAGMGDEEYVQLFAGPVAECLEDYRPQMLLVSAGYDAHVRDPLAGMCLTDEGFGRLAQMAVEWAERLCQGRLLVVLEGGYDLESLCGSVEATLKAMMHNNEEMAPGQSSHPE